MQGMWGGVQYNVYIYYIFLSRYIDLSFSPNITQVLELQISQSSATNFITQVRDFLIVLAIYIPVARLKAKVLGHT